MYIYIYIYIYEIIKKNKAKIIRIKKDHPEKMSYIFSRKSLFIYREMQLSSSKIKKCQERTFQTMKIKKKVLIYW